ncbi:MAG: ribonuclease HI [Chloroherpetonaceae bacterium]|nr:ribonuclease HI [bacterium]
MNFKDAIIVYTDGACSGNPGPGGYAWIIQNNGKEYEFVDIAENTTNNRMELSAVSSSLNFIITKAQELRFKGKPDVEINTDSKYIIDAIEKGWLNSWAKNNWIKKDKEPVKNPDLWVDIYNSLQKVNAKFDWVEGHKGNERNERCDTLARLASLGKIEPHLYENDIKNESSIEDGIQVSQSNLFKFVYNKDKSVEIFQNSNSIVINKDNFADFIKQFADTIIKLNS